MRLTTPMAALLLVLSAGVAGAQTADTEKGPISHPTAATGSGDGTRTQPGPTNPNGPSQKAPDASAGTKASTMPSAQRPGTTTNNPAQIPAPR